MKDIANYELKLHLNNWESRYKAAKTQELGMNVHYDDILQVVTSIGNLRIVFDETRISSEFLGLEPTDGRRKNNSELLKSGELDNHLLLYLVASRALYFTFEELREEIDTILQLLDNEIK